MELETKVGAFVTTVIAVFVAIIVLLGNFNFGGTYSFYVLFTDVSGLPSKAFVKMSGVTIGRVSRIDLYEGKARVMVSVDDDIVIRKDCTVTIASTGMIGTKYLEVTAGTRNAPRIQKDDVVEGTAPYSMDQIINKFAQSASSFIDGFSEVMGKGDMKKSYFYQILQNVASITQKLDKGLGKNEHDVRSMVENLKQTLVLVRNISERIDRIVASNENLVNADVKKLSTSLDTLQTVLNNMQIFTDKLAKGEGTVDDLISNEQLAQDVRDAVKNIKEAGVNLNEMTQRVEAIKLDWDLRTRYNVKDGMGRSDLGIRISPAAHKYYAFSIDNLSSDENAPLYDKGGQRMNAITAVIGRELNQFDLYAGAIHATAGLGMRYAIDKGKNVTVGLNAYRFSRTIGTTGTTPWCDAETSIRFARWGYVSIGVEDVLINSGVTGGVHVTLRDDDLAYLLGLVGISSAAVAASKK